MTHCARKVSAVQTILPPTESLTVEFKSDRNGYPDRELIEALTCLANSAGGELWLGVEDNATPSGLHRKHRNIKQLTALIAEQTQPPLMVAIEKYAIDNITVAKITVPRSKVWVATLEGIYLQRRLKADGSPECIRITPDSPCPSARCTATAEQQNII